MAGRKLITSAKVLELLRDGFQLAAGTYIRGGAMIWMQRKIGCGGESFNVHVGSFRALRDKGLIEATPGQSMYANKVLYRLASTASTTGEKAPMTSIEQSAAAMARYVAELEKEVQALRADALRYQWLRDEDNGWIVEPRDPPTDGPDTFNLDAAIDAAMAPKGAE